MDFGGYWDQFLSLVEFVHNISHPSSIDMAHFEALYRRTCRPHIGWFNAFEVKRWGTYLLKDSLEKVKFILEKLIAAQSR